MTRPEPIAQRPRRRLASPIAAAPAALLMLAVLSPSALAEGGLHEPPEQPFEITQEVLAQSVTSYDAPGSITSLGSTEPAEEQLIVLEADILFPSNAWDPPEAASARLADLVADIPEGVTVQVSGHTDSRPVDQSHYDFDNQQLSENRAQAVADVLATQRPDLTLEVEGLGDLEPAVSENPDDPATFAANRRVELRYGE